MTSLPDSPLLSLLVAVQLGHLDASQAETSARGWSEASGRSILETLEAAGTLDRPARDEIEQAVARRLQRCAGQTPLAIELASDPTLVLRLRNCHPSPETLAPTLAFTVDHTPVLGETIGPDEDRPTLPPTEIGPDAPPSNATNVSIPPTCYVPDTSEPFTMDGMEPTVDDSEETIAGPRVDPTLISRRKAPGSKAFGRSPGDNQPPRNGRYLLRSLKGEGGLGKVWVAQDLNLNRDVALKELKAHVSSRPEGAQRFLLEAQVTGQLEHPNIVPVHDLVYDEETGAPFYTMRLVRGETLSDRIAEYHKRKKEKTADRLDLAKLLTSFVSICEAIGYAHSRDVIHRDLKPENVVLGSFGEVYVLDWGLARVFRNDGGLEGSDSGESEQADLSGSHGSIDLSEDAQVSETLDGRVMGTPSYMAPEQAAGRRKEIGPRSDVYGLGAIFFEILTGSPPHRGRNVMELVRLVASAEPPSARSVDPTVHRALDAICRKAMAKSPANRYATAPELGREIQRWLADEPIQALPETRNERYARWLRRHRVIATAVGLALVTISVVSLLAFLIVSGARNEEAKAHREADDRLAEARRAVDALTDSSRELANVPGAKGVIRRMLQRAATTYDRFAQENSGHNDLQAGAGNAAIRLAEVRDTLDDFAGARIASKKALETFEQLAKAEPNVLEYQLGKIESQIRLGAVLDRDNAPEQAEAELKGAVQALNDLIRDRGETPKVRERLGYARTTLATLIASDETRKDEAERLYRDALKDYDTLLSAFPGNRDGKNGRARARNNLAGLLTRDNAPAPVLEECERLYRTAIEDLTSLLQIDPGVPEYLDRLATSRGNLAVVLDWLKKADAARTAQQDAVQAYAGLVYGAAVPSHVHGLVEARRNLGTILENDSPEQALELYEAARRDAEILTQIQPKNQDYRLSLARCWNNLGLVHSSQARPSRGVDCFDQSIAIADGLRANEPDQSEATDVLRTGLLNRALALLDLRKPEDAAKDIRRLADLSPDDAREQYNAACCWSRAAGLLRTMGTPAQHAKADEYAEFALARLARALKLKPAFASGLDKEGDFDPIRNHPKFPKSPPK